MAGFSAGGFRRDNGLAVFSPPLATTGKTLSKADLVQFTGTEQWYRHPLVRKVIYTDGAQYVAETAGAYWLLDEIAFGQMNPVIAREAFQLWKLVVNPDQTGLLTCEDGNGAIVFTKPLEFTDFPLNEIRFYFTGNTILLPSEY